MQANKITFQIKCKTFRFYAYDQTYPPEFKLSLIVIASPYDKQIIKQVIKKTIK